MLYCILSCIAVYCFVSGVYENIFCMWEWSGYGYDRWLSPKVEMLKRYRFYFSEIEKSILTLIKSFIWKTINDHVVEVLLRKKRGLREWGGVKYIVKIKYFHIFTDKVCRYRSKSIEQICKTSTNFISRNCNSWNQTIVSITIRWLLALQSKRNLTKIKYMLTSNYFNNKTFVTVFTYLGNCFAISVKVWNFKKVKIVYLNLKISFSIN